MDYATNKQPDPNKRPKRSELPVVYTKRVGCPSCGSTSFKTNRSQLGGDGSVTRDTRCRECGQRYDVVVE